MTFRGGLQHVNSPKLFKDLSYELTLILQESNFSKSLFLYFFSKEQRQEDGSKSHEVVVVSSVNE